MNAAPGGNIHPLDLPMMDPEPRSWWPSWGGARAAPGENEVARPLPDPRGPRHQLPHHLPDELPRPELLPRRHDRHHSPDVHRDLEARDRPADSSERQVPDRGAGVLHFLSDDVDDEVAFLKQRIAELEKKATVNESTSRDSGFHTPRDGPHIVNDLIDLNSPPPKAKTEVKKNTSVRPPGPEGLTDTIGYSGSVDLLTPHLEMTAPPGPSIPDRELRPLHHNVDHPPGLRPMTAPSMNMVAHNVLRPKIKEAESIKLLQLPKIPQFEAWKIHLRDTVLAASGRRSTGSWRSKTPTSPTRNLRTVMSSRL